MSGAPPKQQDLLSHRHLRLSPPHSTKFTGFPALDSPSRPAMVEVDLKSLPSLRADGHPTRSFLAYMIYENDRVIAKGDRDRPATLPANVVDLDRNTIIPSMGNNVGPRLGLA